MDSYIGRLMDNRYEILEVIGTGGMAVVYKAKDHRLNRLVAIKILKEEYSRDGEFRRRFHAEAQAVARLSHPNIVSVYDVSSSGETDYIVMELIDGITLHQYMAKKGVLTWRETLHFSIQIAKALEHAHNSGIIHRDIKPQNIMVLKNGSVKVADFGIARVISSQNTLTREALGSVHYISPEQAKGSRVDNRSDLYSLGVIMYEMLTGRAPYDGETPVAVAIQHINANAPMPSTLNSSIPAGLEQITMRAMCADLDRRYKSATQMLYDLEQFRKDPDTLFGFDMSAQKPARPHQTTGQSAQRQNQNAAQRRPAPQQSEREAQRLAMERRRRQEEQRRRKARNRNIAIGLSVAAVALLVVIIILISSSCSPEAAPDQQMVEVPNFVNLDYSQIDPNDYPDLTIVLEESEFDDEVEEGHVISQTPEAREQVKPGTKVRLVVSLGKKTGDLPDLTGQLKTNAEKVLRALEVKLTILFDEEYSDKVEEGRVTRTDPEAHTALTDGQVVTVYISKGPEVVLVPVPKLVGMPVEQAIKLLEDRKLDYYTTRVDNDAEAGTVLEQSREAGEEVPEGTTISLTVSNGPAEEPPEEEPPENNPDEEQPDPEQNPQPPTPVTKSVEISLGEHENDITVSIVNGSTGQTEISNLPVSAGTNTVTVQLTGTGSVTYYIRVDGVLFTDMTVNFDE